MCICQMFRRQLSHNNWSLPTTKSLDSIVVIVLGSYSKSVRKFEYISFFPFHEVQDSHFMYKVYHKMLSLTSYKLLIIYIIELYKNFHFKNNIK